LIQHEESLLVRVAAPSRPGSLMRKTNAVKIIRG